VGLAGIILGIALVVWSFIRAIKIYQLHAAGSHQRPGVAIHAPGGRDLSQLRRAFYDADPDQRLKIIGDVLSLEAYKQSTSLISTGGVALTLASFAVYSIIPSIIIKEQKSEIAASVVREVVATRMFAGPGQYPPSDFRAYGIVAFPARQGDANKDRFKMMCDAYRVTLPHYTEERNVALEDQMVTVWPIKDDSEANVINRIARDKICDRAIPNYGFATALKALDSARRQGAKLNDRGPYILAWAPGSDMQKPDALVLVADLTNVAISDDAELMFRRWHDEIQKDKDLWYPTFDGDGIRVKARLWLDKNGDDIVKLFHLGS
jgi:hypothetical protein